MRRTGAIVLTLVLCSIAGVGLARGGPGGEAIVFMRTGCQVKPLRTVVVSSQASGVIVKMPVEEQDVVKADQLIAELDNTLPQLVMARLELLVDEEFSVDEAKIKLEQAKDDWETAQKLKGRISEAELRATKRKFELAQLRVSLATYQKQLTKNEWEQAKKRLADRRITAPISGIVLTKHREIGESVDDDTHTPVVTLIDVSKLRVGLDLPVEKIAEIRLGQRATVVCDVFPKRTIKGEVVYIEPVVHPETDEFRVKVEFTDLTPDAGKRVRPGMKATVSILKER